MLRFLRTAVAGLAMLACASLAQAQEPQKLRMGMMGWEDTASTSLITARFLEQQGFEVEVVPFSEWGIAFGALSKGDVDLLMAHINYVAADYWERYNSRLEKVSVVSYGLKQGLVVPSYMPITSVEELNSVADQVGGKIIGIEPGTGLMREVGEAVGAYGLNYQVIDGSTAAMTAQLKSTLERGEPIVTMLWTPSWMIQQFDVRFLDDPKGVFAPPQGYYWVAGKGFSETHPHAREAIASVYVPIEDVNQIASEINDGKTMDEAIDHWWDAHAELISKWAIMAER